MAPQSQNAAKSPFFETYFAKLLRIGTKKRTFALAIERQVLTRTYQGTLKASKGRLAQLVQSI